MQVETFECQETASEPIEASEEAIGLIESLELEGQKKLLSPSEEGTQRVPYREMTNEEAFVYGVLCPEEKTINAYERTPIPLRVLQIASHAQQLGIFEKLVVWDRAEQAVKDPVLIGIRPDAQYSWQKTAYILARWGEVLESWPTLLQQAIEMKRQQILDRIAEAEAKAKAHRMTCECLSKETLIENGAAWSPDF